jgi:hypothetical protein
MSIKKQNEKKNMKKSLKKSLKNITNNVELKSNLKKNINKKSLETQKKSLKKSENINVPLLTDTNTDINLKIDTGQINEDKLFCESLAECSTRLLKIIGYYSLTDTLKEQLNSSIINLSNLLKISFNKSIQLCITIFGVISFSMPKLENIYTYTKDKSNEFYNYLPSITDISSKLTSKLASSINSLQNISPKDILIRIKNFIMNHKMLISISTVLLVIISLKICSIVGKSNNIEDYRLNESFSNFLTKYLNFFPFTTDIGKIVLEYTGLFMDNTKDIINKIISSIVSICKYTQSHNNSLNIFKTGNKKIYMSESSNQYIEHQLNPINYLTRYCTNNNGIFLYHSTGTGKTLTALGIAQNLGLPIFLICPSIIINQWKVDYIERYEKTIPKTELYNYEQCYNILKTKNDEWFNTHTLILDEAHNLINFNFNIKSKLIFLLIKFKKRIVLTATPIINDMYDISSTINISAGQFIFPNDKFDFKKKYYKLKKMKSILVGWIIPLLSLYKLTQYYFHKLFMLQNVFENTSSLVFRSRDYGPLKNLFSCVNDLMKNVLKMRKYTGSEYVFRYLIVKLDIINRFINYFLDPNEDLFKIFKMFSYASEDNLNNSHTPRHYYTYDTEREEFLKLELLIASIYYPLFMNFLISIFQFCIRRYYSDAHLNNGVEEYHYPDYELIASNIGSSISYYNYTTDKKNKRLFPKIIDEIIEVPLNNFQIECLKYYIYNKMNIIQYSQLGIIDTKNDYNLINFDQEDRWYFRKYGSFVGNICLIKMNNSNDFIHPYDSILETVDNNTYTLKKSYLFKEVSNKFKKIEELISSKKYNKITIYSNQSKAIKFLSAYLNELDINHLLINNINKKNKNNVSIDEIIQQYYEDSNLKNNSPSILLLDSDYYEGISILRTDAFIVIESCIELSKHTQLMGRCVRLDSHKIPGSKIDIITLVSNINSWDCYLETFKLWSKENKYSILKQFKDFHSTLITPDKLNNEKMIRLKESENIFLKKITKRTIEYEITNKNFKNCNKTECEIDTIDKKSECGIINKNLIINNNQELLKK